MSSARPGAGPDKEVDVHSTLRTIRLDLADYLEHLDPADWARPSLCGGWTVADVVAHVTLSTTETWRDFSAGMIRYLGNFDRWNATHARHQAQRHTPRELVAILRDEAHSRNHSPGSSHLDQLVDLLVHGQDISRVTNSALAVPLIPAVAALDHALGSRWFGARKRFANIHLIAADAGWQFGTGLGLQGPVTALLLLATGRPAGLAEVDGAGLDTVRARMSGRMR